MTKVQKQVSSLVKAFFAQYRVLSGNPSYTILSGKVVVHIPYFLPKGLLTEQKRNALGIAITQLFNTKHVKENKKEKVVEVRLLRLRYPYLNSFIFAQYLALNGGKYNFTRMQKLIFNKAPLANLLPRAADGTSAPWSSRWSETVGDENRRFSGTARQGLKITDFQELGIKIVPNKDQDSCSLMPLPSLLTGVKIELAGRLTTQRSIPRKTVENRHTGVFTVSRNNDSSVDFSQYASKNKLNAFTMKV